jgi:tubulin monoglycylase TTLL3/8
VSLDDFNRYLEKNRQDLDFFGAIFPQLKKMTLDAVKSTYPKLDPFKRINSFELFGLDFMLDDDGKPWLIEINANPCLETSCAVLNRVIPPLIENVCKLAIDPLYPPPSKVYHISYHLSGPKLNVAKFQTILISQIDLK